MIHEPLRYIQFFPSFICNRNCDFCFNKGINSVEKETSPEELAVILRTITEAGIFELDILGGEPTLYPHLERLIDEASENNMRIFLSTNGSDINLLEHLFKRNRVRDFLNIGLSINDDDLSDVLYNFILNYKPLLKSVVTKKMVLPEFAKRLLLNPGIMYNLLFMDSIEKEDLDISLSFPEYFGILEELKKTYKNIQPVYCEGFIPSLLGHFGQYRCPAGSTKLSVMPDGSVYPCYLFFKHEHYTIGNILYDDLKKILNSPILSFFRKFKDNKCPLTDCRLHEKCRGGCPAISLMINGDIESPDPRCLATSEPEV